MKHKTNYMLRPKDLDPNYKMLVPNKYFRCCGCNLPTPVDKGEAVWGPLLGYACEIDVEVYVCRECGDLAQLNYGLRRQAQFDCPRLT
jgi:hypothetical protein